MEKYQQYVNSGFEWIGDIPVQWNNLRLRFVCEFRNGYTPSKANPEFGRMVLFHGIEWKI